MTDLKKIERLWPQLTPAQTLLVSLRVRWFIVSNAYARIPFALRRRFFDLVDRFFHPAHWIR